MQISIKLLIAVMLIGGLSSCVSKKKYDELAASKAATDEQLAQTRQEVSDLNAQNTQLQSDFEAERTRMNGELSSLRTDVTAAQGQITELNGRLEATEAELEAARNRINGIFAEYEATGLSVANRDGKLHIVTDEAITFRSGSARLSSAERNAIDAMGEQLAGSNVRLLIEGHTDNKQFVSDSGSDNWDLSYRRAKAVATRLIRAGVSPENIIVAGAGEYDPLSDNGTSEGRSENRRTEILPNPALGDLMNNN
ncbi:MAG: OmpA family protein [Bacteroidota bacterium]